MLRQILFVALTGVVLGQAQQVSAQREWSSFGVADIDVGRSKQDTILIRSYFLTAIGPMTPPQGSENAYNTCLLRAVSVAASGKLPSSGKAAKGEDVWSALDDPSIGPWTMIPADLERSGQKVTQVTYGNARNARTEKVREVMANSAKRFNRVLDSDPICKSIAATPSARAATKLALVSKLCTAGYARSCSRPAFLDSNAGSLSYHRYAKVFEWAASYGVRNAGEFAQLNSDGSLGQNLVVEMQLEKHWLTQNATDGQGAFEALAQWARKRGRQIDYAVPRLLDLPKETVYRLTDVLRAPAFAIQDLQDRRESNKSLLSISDEIARTRIANCVHFNATRDAEKTGGCSGYKLDTASIAACLGAGRCVPEFREKADPLGLTITTVSDAKGLINASLMPRLKLSNVSYQQFEEKAKKCARDNPRSSKEALHACVLRASLPQNEMKTLNCVQDRLGDKAHAMSCLVESASGGEANRALMCLKTFPTDVKQQALCALRQSLPAPVQSAALCFDKFQKDKSQQAFVTCLALPAMSEDQQRALECLRKYPKDAAQAAMCFGLGEKDVPKELQDGVSCAQSSGSDWRKYGACMASKNVALPGDVGKVVGCAAANGAEPITTAACVADFGLSPEQQILLQCASTSPDPATFAVCTGGQLSLREFAKCQGHRAGDDVCFGPNNEIRKFVANLGLGDIHQDTVVGQLLNFQLDVLKAQVALGENILKDVGRAGADVLKGVTNIAETVSAAAEGLGKAAGQVLGGVGNAVSNLAKAVFRF
jgi:hypothetical protein